MAEICGRALHYVLKVADRKLTARFYRDVLGMKVLRHEEFTEGCEAACNGPYANRWSKTMVGYGPEDNHFVIELIYNYPVKFYEKGNDFIGITIRSEQIIKRAKAANYPILPGNILVAPGGYKFFIIDEPQRLGRDPVEEVKIACSNLEESLKYWNELLGLTIFNGGMKTAVLGFNKHQVQVALLQIDVPINRAQAYGRIAFSCPCDEQSLIEYEIKRANKKILTPLISLDTPGKATVRVIILADPDDHEICFVDDEGFRELSKVDPEADALLDKYINEDTS